MKGAIIFSVIFLILIMYGNIKYVNENFQERSKIIITKKKIRELDKSKTLDSIRIVTQQKSENTYVFIDSVVCTHKKLSNLYKIKSKIVTYVSSKYKVDTVILEISNKRTNKVQVIHVATGILYDSMYKNCDFVRSYSTGFNKKNSVVDNMFGDIVVADLNFDKREDIAVVRDAGGNGGPLYAYYFQSSSGVFEIDTFLSNNMPYFPIEINSADSILKNSYHCGATCVNSDVFTISSKTGNWYKCQFITSVVYADQTDKTD